MQVFCPKSRFIIDVLERWAFTRTGQSNFRIDRLIIREVEIKVPYFETFVIKRWIDEKSVPNKFFS